MAGAPGIIATQTLGSSTTRRFALNGIERMLPPTFHRARVALTFFVLRPFDMLPTPWNRLLGAAVILPRATFAGTRRIHEPAWLNRGG